MGVICVFALTLSIDVPMLHEPNTTASAASATIAYRSGGGYNTRLRNLESLMGKGVCT